MADSSSDLKFVLCPGSLPDFRYHTYYAEIYNCWKAIWTDTFKELGVNKPLYSDAFTRQDFVGAIFHQDMCIALGFYRWVDAGLPGFAEDSYFSNWSEEHLKEIRSRGNKILIYSNMTAHPMARGRQIGFPMRDLLVGMMVETFIHSGADSMTGTPRVDRKVNEACLLWGGTAIDRNVPSGYGDEVDIIGFFKDKIETGPTPYLKPLTHNLWQKRLVIPRASIDVEEAQPNHILLSGLETAI